MKKFLLFCLSATLVVSLPVSSNAQGNREAAKLTKEGADALKAKDYDKAVDLFRKAADLDHHNDKSYSAALQQRAYALTQQQKYQPAIEDYNAALEITPDDPRIFELRAYSEMRLGDYDHALADYNELLKRKQNDVPYLLYRSYIYEMKASAANQTGDLNQTKTDVASAMADCNKVLQIQHNNQEAKARKQRLTQLLQTLVPPTPAGPIAAPSQSPPPPKPKKP